MSEKNEALRLVVAYCETTYIEPKSDLWEALIVLRRMIAAPAPVYDQSVVKRLATQMGWTPPVTDAAKASGDFWSWLPRAYRDGDQGDSPRFTKWNMEVAYRTGQQSRTAAEPAPADRQGVALSDQEIRKTWYASLGYGITEAELLIVRQLSCASSSRAEVERDAARYRWLRDSDRIGDDGDDHIIVGAAGGEDVLWGERMDSAIDADMLAAAEAPNEHAKEQS